MENLFSAWEGFKKGKKKKADVMVFEKDFKYSLRLLRGELKSKTYQHSAYEPFHIKDPKLRLINKATVKDRVLHHAIFEQLYLIFDKFFMFDTYSSRDEKGTHRAVNRLNAFAAKVSKNNTRTCYILKCDIKKFFDSIDQDILISLLKRKIQHEDTLWLLSEIIKSFKRGIPLGNVTSQIFANIYLNELDQFIKRNLKIRHYIRYCDDFVVLYEDKKYLENIIPRIDNFLQFYLKLKLHPNKVIIRKYHQGMDFLGYVNFPNHKTLRKKTEIRMFKKIQAKIRLLNTGKITKKSFNQTIQSYLGVLKHCNSCKLRLKLMDLLKNEVSGSVLYVFQVLWYR